MIIPGIIVSAIGIFFLIAVGFVYYFERNVDVNVKAFTILGIILLIIGIIILILMPAVLLLL